MNMNILKSVVSALVLATSSLVLAETTHTTANVNALQASQITLLKAKFDDVETRAKNWTKANEQLKDAKVLGGGWSVALDESASIASISKWAAGLGLTGHAVTYVAGNQIEQFTRLMKLSKTMYYIGLPLFVAAAGGKAYADKNIVLSQATYEQALANQAQAKTLIERDYAFIMTQAPKLGAKVENNVVSFEGLPEALRNLGGAAVWDLNVNRPQN